MSPISRDNDRPSAKPVAQTPVAGSRTPLRLFRGAFKGQQTPMALVMGMTLVGLVAYLAPGSQNVGAPDTVVARVYGKDILYRDLYFAVDGMMRQYKDRGQTNLEALRPYFQRQALDRLIQTKLIEQVAADQGIVVTDTEVRAQMEADFKNSPRFHNADGSMKSAEEINEILLEVTVPPVTLKGYEDGRRKDLVKAKLVSRVANLVPVDETWVQLVHRTKNEKLTVETATFTPDTAAVADPGDAKLDAFMKSQGARFQVGTRRVLSYVVVDKASFGKTLDPDEAQLKATYEKKKAEYSEFHTAHILLKGENEAQLQEATQALNDVRAKVAGGVDFLKVAAEMSQDPSAKTNGGDLGWTKHGQFAKPYEEAALALKPGELSQPVRTTFGVHLIKLLERREKSFEDVKDEIRAKLVAERFNTKGKEKLEQLRKTTGDTGDLARAAKAQNLNAKTSLPLLEEAGQSIKDLPGSDRMAMEAFGFKVGQVSKVQKVGDAFVLYKVQEERPSTIPPMTEIRTKVLDAYKLEEARKAARAKAEKALASGDLSAIGTVTTQENKSVAELGEVASNPAIAKALLETPEGKTTPIFWSPSGQVWVARIKGRTAAAALTFEQRRQIVTELQEQGANSVLGAEIGMLNGRGRQRPGLSSLWGRVGGIYVNDAFLKLKPAEGEE